MDNAKPKKSRKQRCFGMASRVLRIGAACLLLGALPACAKQLVQIPGAIGPAPAVERSANIGRLVVATEEVKTGSDEDFVTYEPYSVLDSTGRLVKEVGNSSGADVVELSAGRYSIRAETLRRRIIGVEIQIVAGMTTEVHLDGNWKPEPSSSNATLVMGPEGSPIGYRSTEAPTPARSAKAP